MTTIRLKLLVVSVVLCFTAPPPARAQAAATAAKELIVVESGTLPIILSAPHGGRLAVPEVAERKGEGLPRGGSGYFTGRDTGTEELAVAVAAEVERRFKHKPHLVVARFHRKYIDANRPSEIAYEDPDAKSVYDAYHAGLQQACRTVQKNFGRGLLLDLHGQGSAADTVFRGTQNGKTVTRLTQQFGAAAHAGPESFFGMLAAAGWKVYPVDDKREQAGFTGGHIVRTYGSHDVYGIDAIQLEFGGDYRTAERRAATAKTLAGVVEQFSKKYLPKID